jgi:hypothetical protein
MSLSGVQNGYVFAQFAPFIGLFAKQVEMRKETVTAAQLNEIYGKIHGREDLGCLGHEDQGVDCPLTQTYKVVVANFPMFEFIRALGDPRRLTAARVDQVYQTIVHRPITAKQQEDCARLYLSVRDCVQTQAYVATLVQLKPTTLQLVEEVFFKAQADALKTSYSPSRLELIKAAIVDEFEDARALAVLDSETADDSLQTYVPYKFCGSEASWVQAAVKRVEKTADFSFPKADLFAGLRPDPSENEEEAELVERLAKEEAEREDLQFRIGTERERQLMLGISRPRETADEERIERLLGIKSKDTHKLLKSLPDMILDDLLGDLVQELNAIEAAKKARGASEERAQVTAVSFPRRESAFEPVVASPTKLSPPSSGDLSPSTGTESPASVVEALDSQDKDRAAQRLVVEAAFSDQSPT